MSFMSAASKARREAHLAKMRQRNQREKRGGRPRRASDPPIEMPIETKAIVQVAPHPDPPAKLKVPDLPASFRGSISAFQRQPKRL